MAMQMCCRNPVPLSWVL